MKNWFKDCQKSDSGKAIPNLANAYLGVSEDYRIKDIIAYDDMERKTLLIHTPPDSRLYDFDKKSREYPTPLTENDVNIIQKYLQNCGLSRVGREATSQAIEMRARENSFHPVQIYLNNLEWDGEQRLKGWLNAYLGVDHTPYSSQIGVMFLIAMVARILKPGCKADYMLILEGPQGILKSTVCKTLAGRWYSDNLPDLSKSDMVRLSMHLRGKWLIEIAEMSSFNAAESHTLKEFITQTEERFTPKFGRSEVQEPRQCLFIGTTNQSAYLKDETGARRFWPVVCNTIDLEALARDRDQLFAEAVHLYNSGTPWWPDRAFEQEHIKPQQSARYESDIWERAIQHHLLGRYETTAFEIASSVLNIQIGMIQTGVNKRICSILKSLGWESKHTMKGTVWKKQ